MKNYFRYLSFFAMVSLSPQAGAVILAGPNGQANSTEASLVDWVAANDKAEFGYWGNVLRVSDASGIYLGASGGENGGGWVMTAAHVTQLAVNSPSGTINIAGAAYQVHENVKLEGVDLRLYRIGGEEGDPALPALADVPMLDAKPQTGAEILMFGAGGRVEGSANDAGISDIAASPGSLDLKFEATGAGTIRWGTNNTEPVSMWSGYDNFVTRFNESGNYLLSNEASLSLGDSGGPVFVQSAGGWALAGISTFVTGSATAIGFGDYSGFVSIASYGGTITDAASLVPEPSGAALGLGALGWLLFRRNRGRESGRKA